MTFEPYNPRDRSMNGHKHAASWLIWGLLIAFLMLAGPDTASFGDDDTLASSEQTVDDCAT